MITNIEKWHKKKNTFVKDIKDIKTDQFILILDELNTRLHKDKLLKRNHTGVR